MASRDELWVRGRCVERILTHGITSHRGKRMTATDAADPDLIRVCSDELSLLRDAAGAIDDARIRVVASARRVAGAIITEQTMTITMHHVSIVTSAKFAARDAAALRELVATEAKMRHRKLPIVWQNGSAAVLMHEAAGHAAEHDAPKVPWPKWLRVVDEPEFAIDDCGAAVRPADLLTEPPASFRRETFRDFPLRRMSKVIARQKRAPFAVPDERIEVHLVAGGNYDVLRDVVTVHVAVADIVVGEKRSRIRPFVLRRSREEVARSLAGATGDPIRYPGVICSREGQEIAVGSFAPVMITT